ncbi:MAG: acyl-CoA thioesterase [Coxiellaceae bacterium]|nr:acyl-CoA thioesterase [Coxiellaceae bacterium]
MDHCCDTPNTGDHREVTMTEIMTPDMANFGGNVHGGAILQLMDRVAYACASRYSGFYTVTLSVDYVLFKQAIRVGELVTFYASVNHVGKTSMEVGIRVVSEEISSGIKRHTNTSYFTMVAMDEKHKPCKVKPLKLRNDNDTRRSKNAELRKSLRKDYQDKHLQGKR